MVSKQLITALQRAEEAMRDPSADFLLRGERLSTLKALSDAEYTSLVARSGVTLRTAYYWVAIYNSFRGLGVSSARLRKIGWTKLKDIAPCVNKSNVKQLLALAQGHASKDVERLMSDQTAIGNARTINLRFTPEQYVVVEQALIKFGAIRAGRGLEDKEVAVVAMSTKLLKL